jgi:tRNA(Arg) A34 adenosine deaminase TadA
VILPDVSITLPDWMRGYLGGYGRFETDEERMRLAIGLSRENVRQGTGGPFGAAIFESATGILVGAGVNSVLRLKNCTLHGEMVAFMTAQANLRSFTLGGAGMAAHELFSSCDPCAMCLGATLWSGVKRLVCAAGREDATRLRFEEGPVFPDSYAYLEAHGVTITRNFLREEARAVLELYRSGGGKIYNG